MRISDWSSDVCSSDLARRQMTGGGTVVAFELECGKAKAFRFLNALRMIDLSNNLGDAKSIITHPATTTHQRLSPERSEEHTSELQSLMRISYAVLCLKKNTQSTTLQQTKQK